MSISGTPNTNATPLAAEFENFSNADLIRVKVQGGAVVYRLNQFQAIWYVGTGAPGTIPGVLQNNLYVDSASGNIWYYNNGWTQISQSESAAIQNVIYAQDFGTFADTQVNTDNNSWQTNGTVVTCNACTFTSADIGKNIFGMPHCYAGDTKGWSPTLPQTTISGIVDEHNVDIVPVAGVQATTNGCIAWGHSDDAALTAADEAWQNALQCVPLQLPAGVMWLEKNHFITNPTACVNGFAGPSITDNENNGAILRGTGMGTTIMLIAPSMDWSGCTGGNASRGCFGGLENALFEKFTITGLRNNFSGQSIPHTLFSIGEFFQMNNIALTGIGQEATGNFHCLADDGQSQGIPRATLLDIDACGQYNATAPTTGLSVSEIVLTGVGLDLSYSNIGDGDSAIVYVGPGSWFFSAHNVIGCGDNDSNFPIGVRVLGTYWGIGDVVYTNGQTSNNFKGIEVDTGGVAYVRDGNYGCTTCGGGGGNASNTNYIHGGTIFVENTVFVGGATNGGIFGDTNTTPARFFDKGGNSFSSLVSASYAGLQVIGPSFIPMAFSRLPASGVPNGSQIWLADGTAGSPCTGGGSGALAIWNGSEWVCK